MSTNNENQSDDPKTNFAKLSFDVAHDFLPHTMKVRDLLSKEKRIKKREERLENAAKRLNELHKNGVDLIAYEKHLNNELNRRLKKQYGAWFFVLTFVFSTVSYSVVIFESIYDWGIPDAALVALIIEIPIQFVGILLIIANNLFPKKDHSG